MGQPFGDGAPEAGVAEGSGKKQQALWRGCRDPFHAAERERQIDLILAAKEPFNLSGGAGHNKRK